MSALECRPAHRDGPLDVLTGGDQSPSLSETLEACVRIPPAALLMPPRREEPDDAGTLLVPCGRAVSAGMQGERDELGQQSLDRLTARGLLATHLDKCLNDRVFLRKVGEGTPAIIRGETEILNQAAARDRECPRWARFRYAHSRCYAGMSAMTASTSARRAGADARARRSRSPDARADCVSA